MSHKETEELIQRAKSASDFQISLMNYGGAIMTMVTLYVIINFAMITHPVSLRYYIIYTILFIQLGFWMTLFMIDWINFKQPVLLAIFEIMAILRVPGIWIFCWEYFIGMTQILPAAKRRFGKLIKVKTCINVTVVMAFVIVSLVGTIYETHAAQNDIDPDAMVSNKLFRLIQNITALLLIITLLMSITVLIGALILVRQDQKNRQSKQRDSFMDPITFNWPNFTVHCFILITLILVNLFDEIVVWLYDKTAFSTSIYDHRTLKIIIWQYYASDILYISEIVADLFVQFIFYRIITMSCQRLERSYQNKVTEEDCLDEQIQNELETGILKTTTDAQDLDFLENADEEQIQKDEGINTQASGEEKPIDLGFQILQQFYKEADIDFTKQFVDDNQEDGEPNYLLMDENDQIEPSVESDNQRRSSVQSEIKFDEYQFNSFQGDDLHEDFDRPQDFDYRNSLN